MMACHAKDVDALWNPIRARIRLAKPESLDRFLGCYARRFSAPVTEFRDVLSVLPSQWTRLDEEGEKRKVPMPWKPKDPKKIVQGFQYSMSTYFEQVVDKYCMIKGISKEALGTAATPFLDESKDPSGCEAVDVAAPVVPSKRNKVEQMRADIDSLNETLRGVMSELHGATGCDISPPVVAAAKRKAAPKPGSGFECKDGVLNTNAASIGMAALYGARLCRFDLLRPIQRLAERFHKWTELDSKKLHRLMQYISATANLTQIAFIGDEFKDCELALFVDADWASDRLDHKSTTGGYLVLLGPNTFFPLAPLCKKQGATSLSTPEAESIAFTIALRELILPNMDLWELILNLKANTLKVQVYEDNEATQKLIKSGKFDKAMGHVKRTHGISLSFSHDCYKKGLIDVKDCHTKAMCADIFTKSFSDAEAYDHARLLLGIGRTPNLKMA
jgi:hypothetical protein